MAPASERSVEQKIKRSFTTKSRAVKSWKSPETAPATQDASHHHDIIPFLIGHPEKKRHLWLLLGGRPNVYRTEKCTKAWKSRRDESEDFQHLHYKFWLVQYLNIFSCTCSSILTFGYASKLIHNTWMSKLSNVWSSVIPKHWWDMVSSLEGILIVSYKYATMSAVTSTNSHPASPAALSSE